MTLSTIVEILAMLVLSAFYPLITISFFKFRLAKKRDQLKLLEDRLMSAFENSAINLRENMDKEFTPTDYVLPLIFVTSVTFVGMFLIFMGWTMYNPEDTDGLVRSVLWSGSLFWESQPLLINEKRNVAVVAFAILGAFVNATQYIYRRYATVDLTPGNFYSVAIRMMFSAVVALILTHLLGGSFDGNSIIAIAFLTGVFPERGFKVLLEKVNLFQPSKNSAKNYSLDSLEGMSQMHRIRLSELGIDNIQNLAQYDFLLLIIKTPFSLRILLDWIAQAKLIMEFQDDYTAMHVAGIRTILDFWDACEDHENGINRIAEVTKINSLAIEVNYRNIIKDNSVVILKHFREHADQVSLGLS